MTLITKDNVSVGMLNDLFVGDTYSSREFLLKTKFGVFKYYITRSDELDVLRCMDAENMLTMPNDKNNLVHGTTEDVVAIIKAGSYAFYIVD